MIYFWMPFTSLARGEIIARGHWGKTIKSRPLEHQHATREIIYEEIRKEHYPTRPCRFDSVFLCSNLESAKLFGERHRKDATLYEVEIINSSAKQFIANWNMMAQKTSSYSDVISYAHDYWKGIDVPNEFQERVIESDVRIIRKIKAKTLERNLG